MNAANRANVVKTLVAFAGVAFFAILHQLYVTRAHPDALYMDSLRLVYQVEQWRLGHMSFWKLWGLGAEHQGFINPLLMMLNIRFFSLDVMLANRLTGLVITLVAAILLINFNSTTYKSRKVVSAGRMAIQAATSVMMTAICFSWAGFELLTLDLGLPLWLKNLSFVAYFVAHAYYLQTPASKRGMGVIGLVLTLAGPVIVLIIGMGWSYSFVAAVFIVHMSVNTAAIKKRELHALFAKASPLITLLLAQIVYLLVSIGMTGTVVPHKRFSMLIQIPELSLYALGSGVIGVETALQYSISLHVPQCVGGASLVAAIILLIVRYRRGLDVSSLLPIYLLVYGFLVALSVSAARGAVGPMAVMAPRYYMDIMFFYIGLIWLWCDCLALTQRRNSMLSVAAFSILCLVVVIGQSLTYKREWGAAPSRAKAFVAMNQALLEGVPNQAAASLLQSRLDYARLGDSVLLEQHLALYSKLSANECDAAGVRFMSGWYEQEPHGVWMEQNASLRIPACHCDFVATVYLPSGFSERTLTISSSSLTKTVDLKPGAAEQVPIAPSRMQRVLDVSVSATTIPSSLPGGSHDIRSLGAYWTDYSYACSGNVRN
jgi:hypothetical protein